ncbi:hypothetical protein ACFPVY_17055 [Flavobacterium qiangtangense]|uniref:Uncharacterized protein n=1 Tax=Flavobacterium qiangtangense TaxID=1442595 RepID=A0ABW1PT01_9FLAO
MKKYYFINQPPIVKKFTLLVDDITESENWGTTTDLEKIEYNRQIFGEDIDIDVQIRQCLTDEGTTAVFSFGRFITIFQIRKDSKKGRMTFFDFQTDFTRKELEGLLQPLYSENIVKAWFKAYDVLVENFTELNDLAELYKPEI